MSCENCGTEELKLTSALCDRCQLWFMIHDPAITQHQKEELMQEFNDNQYEKIYENK